MNPSHYRDPAGEYCHYTWNQKNGSGLAARDTHHQLRRKLRCADTCFETGNIDLDMYGGPAF